MSVFFEKKDRRGSDEQEGDRPPVRESGAYGVLSGLPYERTEGVVYLLLALTLVAGGAALLAGAAVGTNDPLAVANETRVGVAHREPTLIPAPPRRHAAADAAKPVERGPAPAAMAAATPGEAPSAAAAPTSSPAPSASVAADAPESAGPKPLAPPSQDMREKLMARQAPALPSDVRAYQAAPEAPAPFEALGAEAITKTPEEARTADAGKMQKCFVRLSGRVQTSGACRVKHTGASVVFDVSGKPLEITHKTGRVWAASLGDRRLGDVYKSGACWAARGFYACEKG